jgi:RNA polymerase sigma-70 factor (ECF subfamily)
MQHRISDLASLNDLELMDRLIAHDGQAWREFVRRYDRLVRRCIVKVTMRFSTVLGPEDVREIHANFYSALMANDMHKLRMFKPEKGNKLSTWVGMLAIHCAWDYLRTVSRRPAVDPIAVAEGHECLSPDPYEQTAQREACSKVSRLLSQFSNKDRTFVMLYYIESRSPEEIADEMGISVKTVYSKKHKIRTRLEKLLAQEGLSIAA